MEIMDTIVEDSFLKIEDKENVEKTKKVAVKEYCPLSILHKEYGEVRYHINNVKFNNKELVVFYVT